MKIRKKEPSMARVLLIAAACLATAGCRTTDRSEVKAAPSQDLGLATFLELDKDEEQPVYLMMLQVELNAGVKVAKDRMHSVAGIATCAREGELETCAVRVRLADKELSASQPLTG